VTAVNVPEELGEALVIRPRQLFHLNPPQQVAGIDRNVMTMNIDGLDRTDADFDGTEELSPTARLCVLADDIIGFSLWDRRGTRAGVVTAELSLDFLHPTGWVGPEIQAAGKALTITSDGGCAAAELSDSAGTLIATATGWGNFVDGDADRSASVVRPMGTTADVPTTTVTPLERIQGYFDDVARTQLLIPANPVLANKLGLMHGGIQACAMDLAGNAAVSTAAGMPMYTSSVRINYFRPTPVDGTIRFNATVIRAGRSVAVAKVTSIGVDERVCAIATVTSRRQASAPELPGT
jgi:uncharacterized protein (TIGR00369 family)